MPTVAVVEWLSSSGFWSGWCGELSVVVFDALVLFSIGGKAEARAVANSVAAEEGCALPRVAMSRLAVTSCCLRGYFLMPRGYFLLPAYGGQLLGNDNVELRHAHAVPVEDEPLRGHPWALPRGGGL